MALPTNALVAVNNNYKRAMQRGIDFGAWWDDSFLSTVLEGFWGFARVPRRM
jgi:hypothetical protein